MAWREDLGTLATTCKTKGCSQQTVIDLGMEAQLKGNPPKVPGEPYFTKGNIRFPDCGILDVTGDCFFLEGHFK